ncbi:MAG: GAF domain-containing sensor histidine kinase [Leeuwenhoekiella sp.]
MKSEVARQQKVESYQLLDTLPEKSYDDITAIAAYICDTPISLITMLDYDRNFLKSHYGVPFNESPRKISFCTHAIQSTEDIYVVEDARKNPIFQDNPLVTGEAKAIFYAGVPLIETSGHALGTLCVFDQKPRKLSDKQKEVLLALANQVVNLFEMHRQNLENQQLQKNLIKKNNLLKNFAGVVSHDMKMPLANIITTTDILKAKYKEFLDSEGLKYLEYLKSSSFSLSDYINGILEHYESDNLTINQRETFDLNHLLEEIEDMLNTDYSSIITFPESSPVIRCNKMALQQIFINLITNSLKYSDKPQTNIDINFSETDSHLVFQLADNGMGIPKEQLKEIFGLFKVAAEKDKNGNRGNGIGLSTVKKIVTNLGGKISVDSVLGEGTTFTFTVAKENIPRQVVGSSNGKHDF